MTTRNSDDSVPVADRRSAFKRNLNLEVLLTDLNDTLELAETDFLQRKMADRDTHPTIFLFGPLRSGSTLFLQWLGATGLIVYPTNLLSRFYKAPLLGAMVQMMLTDPKFRFRDELGDLQFEKGFESANGKTRGALSPNEFWYFWRRFLPESDVYTEESLAKVDTGMLRGELYGLTSLFNKPFALKSMILNYHIPFLARIFDKALFVQLTRDPVANVASVLDARVRQFGNTRTWYSFQIPEYPELSSMQPVDQCAGQVTYINRAVSAGIDALPEQRRMCVEYDEFCRSPEKVYRVLLGRLGYDIDDHPYAGPTGFSRRNKLDPVQAAQISEALARFESGLAD